jgi:hypothetical protein
MINLRSVGTPLLAGLLFKNHPHPDDRLAQLDATGAWLEGVRGKTNVARFIRIVR